MQVTLVYQAEMLHRPDMALLNYGWVPRAIPPLLLAHDYGGAAAEEMRSTTSGVITTPPNDDEYSEAPSLLCMLCLWLDTVTCTINVCSVSPCNWCEAGHCLQSRKL